MQLVLDFLSSDTQHPTHNDRKTDENPFEQMNKRQKYHFIWNELKSCLLVGFFEKIISQMTIFLSKNPLTTTHTTQIILQIVNM